VSVNRYGFGKLRRQGADRRRFPSQQQFYVIHYLLQQRFVQFFST